MNESDVVSIERFLDLYLHDFLGLAMGQDDVASNLRMKYFHSLAVHALGEKLSADLHIDDQTSLQVRVAALLHDIGRFTQIVNHETYEDMRSCDHADLGVKILQERNLTAHLGADVSAAIESAVRYHNKLKLPSKLQGQARVVSELLRDADKIDIVRIAVEFYTSEVEGRNTGWFSEVSFSPTCSRIATEALLAGKVVPVTEINTVFDEFLLYLSWVNALHFDVSVRYLAQLGRLVYMVKALPNDTLRCRVGEYISRRVEERCSANKRGHRF